MNTKIIYVRKQSDDAVGKDNVEESEGCESDIEKSGSERRILKDCRSLAPSFRYHSTCLWMWKRCKIAARTMTIVPVP